MSLIKDKLASEGIAGTGNNQAPTDSTDTSPKPDAAKPDKPDAATDDDIDDERLLRAFNKKNGTSHTSLEDIAKPASQPAPPTAEEVERIKAEKRTKARAFGLSKNIITSDDLDGYTRESAQSPYEVGLQLYKAEHKEENLSDAELQEEFDLLYQQNRPDTDKKKVYANKLLQQQYDSYMKNKYGKVLDLETAYDADEATQQQRTRYSSLVEKAFARLPKKLAQELADGESKHSYDFELSAETLTALKDTYLGEEMFEAFGRRDLSPDKIAEAMKLTAIQREFPKIMQTIAVAHRSNTQLNRELLRRGILPDNTGGLGGADQPTSTAGNRGNVTGSHAKAKLQSEKTISRY